MDIRVIGLDLAKSVFQVHGVDAAGRAVLTRRLRRGQVLGTLAQIPPCLVGMEACGGAQHWARALAAQGHRVKLMNPRYVKAYVRTNKSDRADAAAIAEAAGREAVPAVPVKALWQQDLQALHRVRSQLMQSRVALGNQMRGLLAEYGIVLPKGAGALRRALPTMLEDAENGLSGLMRRLLAESHERLVELQGRIEGYNQLLAEVARERPECKALMTVPGLGLLGASALLAFVGNGAGFANARELAAALGVVPRHSGTGGITRPGAISKRGDPYLRTLLVHGARAVLRTAAGKNDRLSRWALAVQARRGANIATVALANKLARIAWAILRHGGAYQPEPTPMAAAT
jgi:transposase